MPTSRGPQALQAPSVVLLSIAPSLLLAYTDWPFRTWGRLTLLGALLLLLWRLSGHISSPFAVAMDRLRATPGINKSPDPNGLRLASRVPDRDTPKLFAVRRADDRTFRIVGETGAPNRSL